MELDAFLTPARPVPVKARALVSTLALGRSPRQQLTSAGSVGSGAATGERGRHRTAQDLYSGAHDKSSMDRRARTTMSTFEKFAFALVCVATAVVAPAARADVPPLDACDVEGAPCDNAGGGGGQPGVCAKATCSRATGLGGAEGVMFYECLRCEPGQVPADGGAGGAPSAGSAGASTAQGGAGLALGGDEGEPNDGGAGAMTGAGGSPNAPGRGEPGDDGSCDCSFKSLGSERGVVALMLGVGLTALLFSRRRR